jgi:hypothetical protein
MSLTLSAILCTLVAAPPAFSDLGEPALVVADVPVFIEADPTSEVLTTLPAGTELHAMPTDGAMAQVSVVLGDGAVVDGFVTATALAELAPSPVPNVERTDPHDLAALVALVTARERPLTPPPTR